MNPYNGARKCKFCGANIIFKKIKDERDKNNGKFIPVNANPQNFIPDPTASTYFITNDGTKRKGRASADGIVGYVEHYCR